jgi:nondiscriminating glutamyl-tRNA synthetase
MPQPVKSRFAPSPTGFIHLGNARTALFSALAARRGGIFLLRIEDTDGERSREEFTAALEEDLQWLGIPWQEGPIVGGSHAPYHQSQRGAIYDQLYQQLIESGHAYPCFCTPQELEISRKLQRSAGQAPRYSGKCAGLSRDEVDARLAKGMVPTLRFHVPNDCQIVFNDLVRGEQRFNGSDIGDFIIRRADNTPAFFFCNAVDDALMGVTTVLRGEDHLTNTPRQILILEALGLEVPNYGHISMIVGSDGSPLSKRHGSRSIRELRQQGYLASAVVNYLARLGHYYDNDNLLTVADLAANFSLERLGKAPARYDAHQLLHWQHQAIAALSRDEVEIWLGSALGYHIPEALRELFIDTLRPNITFPEHASEWADRLFTDPCPNDSEAEAAIIAAGAAFFTAASRAASDHGADFKAIADSVKNATGAKGKSLFMPLRAALTGKLGGPEMPAIVTLLGPTRTHDRLADAAARCGG